MKELFDWFTSHEDAVVMIDSLVNNLYIRMRIGKYNMKMCFRAEDLESFDKSLIDILNRMYDEMEATIDEIV